MEQNATATDLRELLIDAHAHFFFLKGMEANRVRLWQILKDSIVIDSPKNAPMRKTVLGYLPTIDNYAVYEIEGTICSDPSPDQMPNTVRVVIEADKIKKVSRRQFPRVNFTPPVDTALASEDGKKTLSGKILNLSAGGLRVETFEKLSPTDVYTFNFKVELEEEIHELKLKGAILYEFPSDTGHTYGVKFTTQPSPKKKTTDEAPVEELEQTIDLLSFVNRLILEKTVS